MRNDSSPEGYLKLLFQQSLGPQNVSRFSATDGEVYVHLSGSDVERLCPCFNLLGQHGAKFGTTDILDSSGKVSHIRLHVSLSQSDNLKKWLIEEVQ